MTINRSIFVIHSNLFLYIHAITDVSARNVAVQYNHRSVHILDSNACANETAGFVDAPDIKSKLMFQLPELLS